MSIAENIDYGLIPAIEVARELFGSQSGDRTSGDETHFPNHGGLFVNTKKNRWYCHGEGKGGDAIALIQLATCCDFKGALDWLRSHGFGKYLGERPARRTLVVTYDYAGGTVVYHVDSAGLYERSKFGGPWYAIKDKPRSHAETR